MAIENWKGNVNGLAFVNQGKERNIEGNRDYDDSKVKRVDAQLQIPKASLICHSYSTLLSGVLPSRAGKPFKSTAFTR